MKGITNYYYQFYKIKKYRELIQKYLDIGLSYEKAQKLAYADVWG